MLLFASDCNSSPFCETNIAIHERKALQDWQTESGLDVLQKTPALMPAALHFFHARKMQYEHHGDPQNNKEPGCEWPSKNSQSST